MNIRQIKAETVTQTVKQLFLDCNYFIGKDIMTALEKARENEKSKVGKSVLTQIIENDKLAAKEEVPLCQDTGMAILFVEYGDKVVIEDGSFEDAVNEGVRQAYKDGYLRKSVVNDPVFDRLNTKDNTPAIIHTRIVKGDKIKITAGGKVNRKRRTKRDEFLERMERLIPWKEWCALVEPYYPSGRRGRPPRGVEIMLRMYLLSVWFNLSDEGVEDAIYDSYAFRQFLGIDFWAHEQAPDATTLCKFRKMLTEQGVTEQLFESIKALLEENGQIMHGGSIVDATIIEAPSSTKNAENRRDPEMHQVKKGNEWHFGERIHIGVDAGAGYVHSLEVTAANVPERDVVPRLVRPDDETVSGDSGYTGMEKREEIKNDPHLSKVIFRVTKRNRYHLKPRAPGFDWDRHIEYQIARTRSKVEYVFLIVKRLFGYRKVRYRGILKNKAHAYTLFTCANLYMLAQSGFCAGA